VCYFSYDPDIYINEKAKEFPINLNEKAEYFDAKKKGVSIDNTRSGVEFREILRLLRQCKNKKQVFEHMQAFSKWSRASEQYREHTFQKAIDSYTPSTNLSMAFGQFTDMLAMADSFLEIQPLFYDRNKLWYLWDFNTHSWKIVDETDILNAFDNHVNYPLLTIKSRTKYEILEALRRRARVRIPKDSNNDWIQFQDKIVDVKTGQQFDASPDFFFSNPIPFAIGDAEDTPVMDKLFREWVVGGSQDESYISTLYEMIAYSTMKKQFLHRLFALTGTGSNGKGCFLQIVNNFLGIDNVAATEIKMLAQNRFESSALYRKQAAFMGEVDVHDLSNTNMIKMLTGEDLIRDEFKGKTNFSGYSFCTCFIATNSLPFTPDKSDGFYRRWLLVEFPHQFSTGKDVVGEIPDYEYNNLAKKCIRIAKELFIRGAFTNEGSILDRKSKYEERSDPLSAFLRDYCEETSNQDIIFSDFYMYFRQYLRHQRLREISKKKVSMALRKEGYVVEKKHYTKNDDKESTAYFVLDMKIKETIPIDIHDTNVSLNPLHREQSTELVSLVSNGIGNRSILPSYTDQKRVKSSELKQELVNYILRKASKNNKLISIEDIIFHFKQHCMSPEMGFSTF